MRQQASEPDSAIGDEARALRLAHAREGPRGVDRELPPDHVLADIEGRRIALADERDTAPGGGAAHRGHAGVHRAAEQGGAEPDRSLAEDRQGVAARDVQPLQRAVRGAGAAGDRRAFLEGKRVREGHEREGRHGHVRRVAAVAGHAVDDDALAAELSPADAAMLAAPAALVVVDHYALAGRCVGFADAGAAGGDDAAGLVAGHDRAARAAEAQRGDGVADRAIGMQIAPAHPRSFHGDDDLAGTRRRVGEFPQLELALSEENYATHTASFAATLSPNSGGAGCR